MSPPTSSLICPHQSRRVEKHDLAHLDPAPLGVRIALREVDRLRAAGDPDEAVPANRLLRLGERPVGHQGLPASRLAASMIQNPPTISLLSANGPSLTNALPSRTRTRAPADSATSGAPRRSFPWLASSPANFFISAGPPGSPFGAPFRSMNKSMNSTDIPPRCS